MNPTCDAAFRYLEAELSVIPLKLDGTKEPAVASWAQYQNERPTRKEVMQWFRGGAHGIAIIGGKASNYIERIDFDAPGMFEKWLEVCSEEGCYDLAMSLPLVKTPREGGWHIYYKCSEVNLPAGIKLARDAEGKGLIETKGSGGYTVAPGSPAATHETGKEYELVRGDLCQLPTITAEDREALLSCAYVFNEYRDTKNEARPPKPKRDADPDEMRPGDIYNESDDFKEVLRRHGWEYVRLRGNTEQWRRPGKTRGISATFNHADSRLFYPFSSNSAPFDSGTSYSPFAVLAVLEYDGDFSATAAALAADQNETIRAELIESDGVIIGSKQAGSLPPRVEAKPFKDLVPPSGFLKDYVDYASNLTDAPIEFHLASGLTAVAAALGNSVSVPLWGQKVYPNLWTLILAPSGFYRKSTAISIGLRILRGRCSECILADDFTREKLIENLAGNPSGVLPVYEFGELLAKLGRDYNAGTKEFLTQLYDGNDYKRSTKKDTQTISDPAVSIMAASTIDWIHDRITGGDIKGGFLARFCFWPAQEKNGWKGVTPTPDFGTTQQLQIALEVIHSLNGSVEFDAALQSRYDTWVKTHEEEVNERHLPAELQGFYTRLATYVVKFAMVYHIAAYQNTDISMESMDYAIRLADYLKSHLVRLVEEEMLTTRDARELRQVKDIVKRSPGITRSELLRQSHMMAKRLDEITQTLHESGEVMIDKIEGSTKPKLIYFVGDRL